MSPKSIVDRCANSHRFCSCEPTRRQQCRLATDNNGKFISESKWSPKFAARPRTRRWNVISFPSGNTKSDSTFRSHFTIIKKSNRKKHERKALIIYHCCRLSRPPFANKVFMTNEDDSELFSCAFKANRYHNGATHANICSGILIFQLRHLPHLVTKANEIVPRRVVKRNARKHINRHIISIAYRLMTLLTFQ